MKTKLKQRKLLSLRIMHVHGTHNENKIDEIDALNIISGGLEQSKRTSQPKSSIKKVALKNFTKCTGKYLCLFE